MAINSQLLKSIIMKYDKTQAALADSMRISLSCLNAKINETDSREFKQNEIAFIRDRYNLSESELIEVFFAPEVSKKDTFNNAATQPYSE